MNRKKLKVTRRYAEAMMYLYVIEHVLTKDLTEGLCFSKIIGVLPDKVHFTKGGFTKVNGIGTKRWFYRMAKKHPDWGWEDYNRVIQNK